MIIDAHCYIGENIKNTLTPQKLLEQMKIYGLEKAIVCPAERYISAFNREGNDYILNKAMERHPDKFIGLASANPVFEDKAVKELKRAIKVGLKGLLLDPKKQGFSLSEGLIEPFLELAQEYKLPVYLHLDESMLSAALAIITQFLEVNFILGGFISPNSLSDFLNCSKNLPQTYFETSIFASASTLQKALKIIPPSRIIFASDSPLSDLGTEFRKVQQLNLSEEPQEKIFSQNISRLLEEHNQRAKLKHSIPSRYE